MNRQLKYNLIYIEVGRPHFEILFLHWKTKTNGLLFWWMVNNSWLLSHPNPWQGLLNQSHINLHQPITGVRTIYCWGWHMTTVHPTRLLAKSWCPLTLCKLPEKNQSVEKTQCCCPLMPRCLWQTIFCLWGDCHHEGLCWSISITWTLLVKNV